MPAMTWRLRSSLRALVLQAFLLQPFQTSDAFDGGRHLFRHRAWRSSSNSVESCILKRRYWSAGKNACFAPVPRLFVSLSLGYAWARTVSIVSIIAMLSSSGIKGLSRSPALRQRATSSAS